MQIRNVNGVPVIFMGGQQIYGTDTYGNKKSMLKYMNTLGYDGEKIWAAYEAGSDEDFTRPLDKIREEEKETLRGMIEKYKAIGIDHTGFEKQLAEYDADPSYCLAEAEKRSSEALKRMAQTENGRAVLQKLVEALRSVK